MSVLCGIDVLVKTGFEAVRGQKVGLVTNHTGLTADLKSTIDVLHDAAGVELAALFSPEHGLRGDRDEKVSDDRDPQTGLPVYSLYGSALRPSAEQLRGLDALIYDIQDIGCRYYTYISTLGLCMQACAEAGLHYVVLDRPNPIGGRAVEGPPADQDALSFTAWHTIPVRHGMTVGELARMYNVERNIGAGLIVVRCEGWSRAMWWDATGLTWTNPSPNMRCLNQATLYPGVGLLETTNLSVGRGTDTPFEHFGAPWLNGRELAALLNARNIAGIRFVPVRFTPASSVHRGMRCSGINLVITNRAAVRPVRLGIEIACALYRLHPTEWNVDRYMRLLANKHAFEGIRAGLQPDEIERSWRAGLQSFARRRARFTLYS